MDEARDSHMSFRRVTLGAVRLLSRRAPVADPGIGVGVHLLGERVGDRLTLAVARLDHPFAVRAETAAAQVTGLRVRPRNDCTSGERIASPTISTP